MELSNGRKSRRRKSCSLNASSPPSKSKSRFYNVILASIDTQFVSPYKRDHFPLILINRSAIHVELVKEKETPHKKSIQNEVHWTEQGFMLHVREGKPLGCVCVCVHVTWLKWGGGEEGMRSSPLSWFFFFFFSLFSSPERMNTPLSPLVLATH
jgi:hypothetical protein